GFDMVLTGGQIERRIPLQEEKMRLVVASHLQHAGIVVFIPNPFPVELVHAKRQHRLHGAEPKRPIVLEQVDTRPHARLDRGLQMSRQPGISRFDELGAYERQRERERSRDSNDGVSRAVHQNKSLRASWTIRGGPALVTFPKVDVPTVSPTEPGWPKY